MQLRHAIEAGMRADPNALAAALHRLDQRFPGSRRSAAYLHYSLRYAIADHLQRRPTLDDIPGLADELYPQFAGLTTVDRGALERLLQLVLEVGEGKDLSPSLVIVLGTAALASLLGSVEELDLIREHLEPWYEKNQEEFAVFDPR